MTDQTPPAAKADKFTASRRAQEKCRSCGGAWFGDVAYCPYCGLASASPVPTALEAPPPTVQAPPRAQAAPIVHAPPEAATANTSNAPDGDARSWKSWAKPLAAGALVGVVLVLLFALATSF